MSNMKNDESCIPFLETFSTCPQISAGPREGYLQNVVDVAKWSEEHGCRGILVYTDNFQADPWLIAQIIIQNTDRLTPLVAIQPAYMHPYSVAKMIATLGHLYGRRIYLNMVAGGFKNDLAALNDTTPRDKRYQRLTEYTLIIKQLLNGRHPVNFSGEFYEINNLRLIPPLPPELFPGIFVSGSSEAGVATAQALGATAIKYPKPADECSQEGSDAVLDSGIRVGIIARPDEAEAWRVAHGRFPADRKGQLTHQLAMAFSDSSWHRQLSEMSKNRTSNPNPYWLVPFENYKTFCPYLVGSYDRVAEEVSRYMAVGYRTFILDIPPDQEELRHTGVVFRRACERGHWMEPAVAPTSVSDRAGVMAYRLASH
jgi:alkanesulfonate monooxygenase